MHVANIFKFVNKLTLSIFLISDRVKAEMDLKELSETVQLQQQQHQQQQQPGGTTAATTPKRPIRSLDKTIESCKAQLGTFILIFPFLPLELIGSSKYIHLPFQISFFCLLGIQKLLRFEKRNPNHLRLRNRSFIKFICVNIILDILYVLFCVVCLPHIGIDEISEDVYKGVDHSDSEDSEKSDSSDSEYLSDEDPKPKSSIQDDKDKAERKRQRACSEGEVKEGAAAKVEKTTPEPAAKDKPGSNGLEKDLQDKPRTPQSQPNSDKTKSPEESSGPVVAAAATSAAEQDSDSERELVIDLGDEQGGRDAKRARREAAASAAKTPKESSNVSKSEGEAFMIY